MRQELSPFVAFLKVVAFGVTLLTLFILSPGLSSTAQTQRNAPSRQLQQTEPLSQWPSKAKRWALVIGVDNYKDGQISPLKGSDNDARMLADALVRYAGFPQDQVILMSTDQPEERQPTRVNILRRLSNLASVVPKDGLLLVSFAGHGMERNGQAYLLPSDAQISDDITFLEETAVSVSRIRERIRATGVNQVVVLLDACRNDPGGRADAPNPLTAAYTKFNFDVRNHEVQAFATLYATAVGQRAYEYTEKRQGYFTWAIVEGIKGGAANEKGEVTLAGLVKYVQENVPKRISIDLGGGKQQRPFAVIEGYKAEDLVIAMAEPALISSPLLPTVDEIIRTNIQSIGGKTTVEKLHTIVATGVYEATVGTTTSKGNIETYIKLPNKSLEITNYPDGTTDINGYDGTVGWVKHSNEVRLMSDVELGMTKQTLALSYLTSVEKFKEMYPQATLRGKQKVGDSEAYAIEVTPRVGRPETLYFDTQSGLLIRFDSMDEMEDSQEGVTYPTQLYIENYVDVIGVRIPMTQRQVTSGYTTALRIFNIKYNVPIDDTKFSKPLK
jgi:hypothetical protein